MYWSDLELRVRNVLASADSSVLLAAPFVKRRVLEMLLAEVAPGVAVELYTRWKAEDVASGVTDTDVLGVVEARSGRVWLVDDLHAKIVTADMSRGLIGSANLTAAGLGTSARPNLELMTDVADPVMIEPFVLQLRHRSRLATAQEAAAIEEAATRMRLTRLASVIDQPDAAPLAEAGPPMAWLPRFRSPDRLFGLYSDREWLADAKPQDPALADLAQLSLPSRLDERTFDEHVRRSLLTAPAVLAIDASLSEPRRFGAISAALRDHMPGASHEERQRAAQTLIRWLLHFASDRYGMRTPAYSEVLFRR